jgi:acetolactate synthase-1/2/3 large subunit
MSDKMLTGAETLVEIMIEEGVEFVFGLPGGNAIPIYDALVGRKVKLVLTRHEQGAVHMADGYARATGKVGVALVTSGPGATNTVTGLFTALMDSVPLVVVCGQSPTPVLGLDAFQEADVSGLTYPCVKHSYLVKDVEDIPRVMREAFYIARSGRPGPVLIDMPKDISGASISELGPREFHLPGYSVPLSGEDGAVAKAAKLLKAAKRPILLVGHGAAISGASREVRELVERMRIPAVSTLLGKGVLPESHELSLGMLGMHGTAYANKAMVACDLVMSVGSRWDDRIVGSYADFCRGAVKIHVDIDPAEIDKVVKVDVGIVGDAKTVLMQLLSHLERGDTEEWVRQVARWRREYPLSYRKEGKVRAQHVIEELRALAGDKAIFTTDVGQHQMWAAQSWPVRRTRSFLTSGGLGTMGFALPAAMGAALANPGSPVLVLTGDGSLLINIQELATIAENQLDIKICVFNNGHLGLVRQQQELFYGKRYVASRFDSRPDFAAIARGFGIPGCTLRMPHDGAAIARALATRGPVLLDIEVAERENVYPMVPPGKSNVEAIWAHGEGA